MMGKTSSRSDGNPHADRKFEKKVRFYELVRDAVSQKTISKEKQKKRSRQKKLKSFDLSSLSEYLPELKDPKVLKTAEVPINGKRRHQLMLNERNRLKAVINHPIFQSDPLGAIYQHLLNTQPPTDEKPKRRDCKTRKKKSRKKKPEIREAMEI